MAVHEGFHVNVQAPAWIGERRATEWPAWTGQQPDRGALAARCYGPSGTAVSAERAQLVDAAMAALGNADRPAVCTGARAFLEARRKRWQDLAADAVPVSRQPDSVPGTMSCRQAEAGMELTEGAADMVFWMTARDLGIVTDAQVRQRFSASQRDLFYLTGSMQLIVLRALVGERSFQQAMRTIASSASWRDAEPSALLESAVARQCPAAAPGR
jgi:hypothetical protein